MILCRYAHALIFQYLDFSYFYRVIILLPGVHQALQEANKYFYDDFNKYCPLIYIISQIPFLLLTIKSTVKDWLLVFTAAALGLVGVHFQQVWLYLPKGERGGEETRSRVFEFLFREKLVEFTWMRMQTIVQHSNCSGRSCSNFKKRQALFISLFNHFF